ncbi:hypothetical protein [Microvirga sp. G4-2]|uniref:hypothetical protein n=1 Tax=Microvirga sp. G4-2 TaxID=3434467 RepID=UPI0040439D5F
MNERDQSASHENKPEQGQDALGETIQQANRAIEASRAEIARSQALGRSEAELSRQFDKLNKEHDRLSGGQRDGT